MLTLAGFLSVLALTTSLLIYDAQITPTGFTRKSGVLYPLFVVYFLAAWLTAFAVLVVKWFYVRGQARAQLQYLAIGLVVSFVGGITTNLLLPFLVGRTAYTWLGPYFTLPLVLFVGHAVIRHRLMNIRVVIRQGVVYVSAIVAAGVVFVGAAQLLRRVAGLDRDHIPIFQALAAALVLAVLFGPLKAWLQRSLNRYVYRETYDYQRIVREASRQLGTMLELRPLLAYLTHVAESTFKAEALTIYLRDPSDPTMFRPVDVPRGDSLVTPMTDDVLESRPLVEYLSRQKRTLVREEALRESGISEGLKRVAEALEALSADLAFPLVDEATIAGFVLVGPKRSGDPYYTEDIDLLETLIGQAAISMKNSELYRQVVRANEYVDNILSTMDSGVIAVSSTGQISLFNLAAEQLTGLAASDTLHRPLGGLPDALAAPLRATLRDHASRSQLETSLSSQRGAIIPIACSTAALRGNESDAGGALIVFSDLTRLKDLEQEKRRVERLASFGALASGVAHEIKNPLVAIRTFAELLPERFTDADFRDDFSKVVIREISRIDDLVARLRGIAASAPRHTGPVDVREPLADTLALLRAQFEHTRTTVHSSCDDMDPYVNVDEAQLKQIFLNLILNALEAMGPGGALGVIVSRRHVHENASIVIEVSDTGPGIPDTVRATMFDPFFTTKPKGSGLGLAICRGIADAHRGTIRADNRVDTPGAMITVELPAAVIPRVLNDNQALVS